MWLTRLGLKWCELVMKMFADSLGVLEEVSVSAFADISQVCVCLHTCCEQL